MGDDVDNCLGGVGDGVGGVGDGVGSGAGAVHRSLLWSSVDSLLR